MSFGPTFLNTLLLGGTAEDRLRAARAAGFDQVEPWTGDVEDMTCRKVGVHALAGELGLGFTDYQVLLDFDGAPGDRRAAKRAEAVSMLNAAAALDIPTVLVPASTDPDCDAARVAEDLAWLVGEARRLGLHIAYGGMPPLAGLAAALDAIGYGGPVGLEVFNDGQKAEPPETVARRAFATLGQLLRKGDPA